MALFRKGSIGSTILPPGYKELEYIEGTGTQCIDTSITYQQGSPEYKTIEVDAVYTSGYVFGVANSSNTTRNRLLLFGSGGHWQFISHSGNAGTQQVDSGIPVTTNRVKLKLKANYLYIDGVSVYVDNNINAMSRYTATETISLFAYHAGKYYGFAKMKLYHAVIKDGEDKTTLIDLIPCKRVSDNAVGMYDLISGSFFGNAGTGEFVAGPQTVQDALIPVQAFSIRESSLVPVRVSRVNSLNQIV